ncbi:hypothetical protein ATO7_05290 [Oceanococcus atlanticus]|uniref:TraC-like protein n=1 Tax=Oceanococcus atlanticus TaxID=1317117 RepID=A0A1Y1SHZ6_9GAMM|nr:hypothetical protein [Oceanococcus atlanticus]ORE89267.1 hypothetical protein ATO7_05290 [Oceanococcus atlanticus]
MTKKIDRINQKIAALQAQLEEEERIEERRRARAVELAARSSGLLALGLSRPVLEKEFSVVVERLRHGRGAQTGGEGGE